MYGDERARIGGEVRRAADHGSDDGDRALVDQWVSPGTRRSRAPRNTPAIPTAIAEIMNVIQRWCLTSIPSADARSGLSRIAHTDGAER